MISDDDFNVFIGHLYDFFVRSVYLSFFLFFEWVVSLVLCYRKYFITADGVTKMLIVIR